MQSMFCQKHVHNTTKVYTFLANFPLCWAPLSNNAAQMGGRINVQVLCSAKQLFIHTILDWPWRLAGNRAPACRRWRKRTSSGHPWHALVQRQPTSPSHNTQHKKHRQDSFSKPAPRMQNVWQRVIMQHMRDTASGLSHTHTLSLCQATQKVVHTVEWFQKQSSQEQTVLHDAMCPSKNQTKPKNKNSVRVNKTSRTSCDAESCTVPWKTRWSVGSVKPSNNEKETGRLEKLKAKQQTHTETRWSSGMVITYTTGWQAKSSPLLSPGPITKSNKTLAIAKCSHLFRCI